MVGIRSFPFGPGRFSGAMLVLGSVTNGHQKNAKKYPWLKEKAFFQTIIFRISLLVVEGVRFLQSLLVVSFFHGWPRSPGNSQNRM